MKLTRVILALALAIFAVSTSASISAQQTKGAALGLVAKAQNAQIGSSPLSEGATIYSGDYLNTASDGTLLIRIGPLSLSLESSSAVHIYRAPYGAVVELDQGSIVYTTPGTGENLITVANDVRVTPAASLPDLGRVSINDPCNVTVYSQRGQADVKTGTDSHFVEEGKAYRVRGDNEISYRQYVSPDDNDYHNYHGHKPCVALETVHGHAPIAPGQSHFLLVTGAVVGVATGIAIWKAYESPNRP
jgi:hypothetical protein